MIGHEILLQGGDSLSRVLPIEKEAGSYKIQFEAHFQFEPEKLVSIIDRVVEETAIAKSYLVEVAECESRKVVYSYEVGNWNRSDVIPCAHRVQPKGCYLVLFTIFEPGPAEISSSESKVEPFHTVADDTRQVDFLTVALLALPMVLWIGWIGYNHPSEKRTRTNSQLISIGAYLFDHRTMELLYENERTELTSKESDLLYLLYTSANETLEREHILNAVWGDEGDYIGRTLDVFISKLRKKLEADRGVRIVNIRGVGYKLVINDA